MAYKFNLYHTIAFNLSSKVSGFCFCNFFVGLHLKALLVGLCLDWFISSSSFPRPMLIVKCFVSWYFCRLNHIVPCQLFKGSPRKLIAPSSILFSGNAAKAIIWTFWQACWGDKSCSRWEFNNSIASWYVLKFSALACQITVVLFSQFIYILTILCVTLFYIKGKRRIKCS